MLGYYVRLAVRSLKRNVVLTSLMIAAIAVGIGASMTTLTVFRAMSGDPIPRKAPQLFVPQIDNWGPNKPGDQAPDGLNSQLDYIDAMALMKARKARRQSAMFLAVLSVRPPDASNKPFKSRVRAAYADFFPMFEVPFWVAQRRRQIGIRRALGATQSAIVRYFQTENFLIGSAGGLMGIALAIVLNLWMVSRFEMVRLHNSHAIGGALVILLLGQLAVLWPALRAGSIAPALATRGG